MLWGCFSAAGIEGLVRIEEKLNAPNYWDSLNENQVQSIQNLRLDRRFTFQQDNDPKHTVRVAYRQLCECPWVVQPQPGLECNQKYLEKPENVHLPPFNLTELETWRDEKKNCRKLPIPNIFIPKKAVKVLPLSKGTETYAMYLFQCRLM